MFSEFRWYRGRKVRPELIFNLVRFLFYKKGAVRMRAKEMRLMYVKFFEERGHKEIRPRR